MKKKVLNIVVCGCFGKMGKAVLHESEKHEDVLVTGGIERGTKCECSFPIFADAEEICVPCDVIVDFSSPSALGSLLNFARSKRIALVLCSTGYSEEQREMIKACSNEVPIFFSSNMSVAVNLMVKLSEFAKRVLGSSFDIEIIERHHNQKSDAPSGTALMIAEALSENDTEIVYDRTILEKSRKKNEIGIHCIRGGNIKGEHEIIFAGNGETLSFKHVADSREIFAAGAINAAKFIVKKPKGVYNMNDLISF
ncbi:MAG: 4-hydroxy-tetrahydrodipicolinate reductase [Oscillospiraceae bacterium]|jgi:4-hydroxy-tetrahydrodipicolinate reductase|nr:4-hydroxy-tetrahydrodipicolinate reductase [Oscillospiraceae bacterium]